MIFNWITFNDCLYRESQVVLSRKEKQNKEVLFYNRYDWLVARSYELDHVKDKEETPFPYCEETHTKWKDCFSFPIYTDFFVL